MKSQTITIPSVGTSQGFTATQSYTYDSLNRLESAGETIAGQQTWRQAFTYDRYGNRRFNEALTTTNGTGYNQAAANPTISTATNRISSAGYSYDAAGNLTGDTSGRQFFYDAENHQKEVKDGNGATVGVYFYDGEGRRVKKVVPGGETIVFVYDGGGKLVAEYSTQTAANPAVNYLTQDHLGSPRVITDNVGKVVARKDFGAFGDETFTPQRTEQIGYKPENIRQDYTGYQKDDESGLEFAQARYYNTLHGRFTSIDPLTASANVKDPQTFNRYTYAMNSPYKFTDPLGLISENAGSPCGSRCRNSGGYVSAESFHGKIGNMNATAFADMDFYAAVDQAIANLETYDLNAIGEGEVYAVKQALERMLKKGNAVAKRIAANLINNGIRIESTSSATASTSVFSVAELNSALREGCMGFEAALGHLVIRIPSFEFSNPVSSDAAIESTLVHEGIHAESIANVIASISAGGSYDKSRVDDELDAKLGGVNYEIQKGGVYLKHGKAAGLIDSNGKPNMTVINSAANTHKGQTIRDHLKAIGVKW